MKKKLKTSNSLGNIYGDGEYIVKQGESGSCMYEIQDGKVEVVMNKEDSEIQIDTLHRGDFFGEMAIFEQTVRSASVRTSGKARVLTIDKKLFFKRISEDPTLAFRILEKMSNRIRKLDNELMELKKGALAQNRKT